MQKRVITCLGAVIFLALAAGAPAGPAAPPAGERWGGDLLREREPARPELRPVRQELLALERLLAQQRLAVARREHQQLAPGERHHVLDELVHRAHMIMQLAVPRRSRRAPDRAAR